ncbi:hypothetical protein B0H13DRAFT_1991228 [Mycena leptocephala]|nr:hypothetical protein B0H13DRAFT_1991228 [Mycena leptocephala]
MCARRSIRVGVCAGGGVGAVLVDASEHGDNSDQNDSDSEFEDSEDDDPEDEPEDDDGAPSSGYRNERGTSGSSSPSPLAELTYAGGAPGLESMRGHEYNIGANVSCSCSDRNIIAFIGQMPPNKVVAFSDKDIPLLYFLVPVRLTAQYTPNPTSRQRAIHPCITDLLHNMRPTSIPAIA